MGLLGKGKTVFLAALAVSVPASDAGASLRYSSFLGDSNTRVADVAVDADGATYLAGSTTDPEFPTTPGAFDPVGTGASADAFLAKLSPDGSRLEYSTLLSGSSFEEAAGLAVDGNGNAYVAGFTNSGDFPTTAGAYDRVKDNPQWADAFVAKLSADGSQLLYGSYLGGAESDEAFDVAVDPEGAAYMTGVTTSVDFPTTPGAFDRTPDGIPIQDAFVTKLAPDGSGLEYSTYLPGSGPETGNGVAVDRDGKAYVTGFTSSPDFFTTPGAFDRTISGPDVFVTKLEPDGSEPAYSTSIGGVSSDSGHAIDVDRHGNAYVTGRTLLHEGQGTPGYPTTPGAYDTTPDVTGSEFNGDMFVSKLPRDGSRLVYSSVLGDVGEDAGDAIAVDRQGRATLLGMTEGQGFPTTANAYDATHNGGLDAAVARFNARGSRLAYSTFLGGTADDGAASLFPLGGIALDASGVVHVGGRTSSQDFPTTPDAYQSSFDGIGVAGFVSRFDIPRGQGRN
jgi:hypothetical protein